MRSILCLAALLSFIGCTHDVTDPAAAGAPALLVVSGSGQSGVAGTELPQPLVIKATRANGSPLVNVAVNFHVTSGGGGMFAGTAITDAKGIAKDYWTLGTSTAEPQRVEVRAVLSSGEKEVFGTFAATALPGPAAHIAIHAGDGQTALAQAAVAIAPAVLVSDQYANPVPGVAVIFAVASGGGSVSGANPTTDAAGIAAAGSWTLGAAGANTLTATAVGSGIAGNPVTFSAIATGGPAIAWIALAPSGAVPPPRAGHSAVLDAAGAMLVFGGFRNGIGNVNDLWRLSHPLGTGGAAIWSAIAPNGSAPAPRAFHSAVFDPSSDRMIVFGGDGAGGALNDVWVLENASGSGGTPTWTELQPTGSPPAARFYHSAVYDPTSKRMIVFGGGNLHFPAATYYDDVWVLTNANGLGGTAAWIQLTPGGSPGARTLHSAVYDAQFNRMTVFGGQNSGSVGLNDVWVLFNANGAGIAPAWVQITPTGVPPTPRIGQTAVYDPASFRMTVFGGFGDFGTGNQTWVLTFANAVPGASPAWMQLAPAGPLPPARWTHSAVYDPASNRMTVFGGRDDLNDSWVLTDANGSP